MRLGAGLDAAALVAVKLALGAALLASGFHAVSDDDYARLVIALGFARAPALDPSGTSWLPLPFWIYGTSYAGFGDSLGVARATALTLGALGSLAVWFAARLAGVGRWAALGAALAAAAFPYSAYLGVATVPEAPASALVVLGVATLGATGVPRLLGALALTLACASRYEPWPAALVFAALCAADGARQRRPVLLAAAVLAVSFPTAWLLHGVVRHDSALFFLERVAGYRAALGGDEPLASRVARIPLSLFTREPELMFGALGAGLAAHAFGRTSTEREALRRALTRGSLCLAAVFAVLVVGDALGGAPTHHNERTLLAVWYWCAVLGAAFAERVARRGSAGWRVLVPVLVLAVVVGAGVVRRRFPRDPFAERRAELAIGAAARALQVDRLAIDAPDYGYFAIQASFGRPSATHVLDPRDPRRPRARDLLLEAPAELGRELDQQSVRWLAVPTARAPAVRMLGRARAHNSRWVLLELR